MVGWRHRSTIDLFVSDRHLALDLQRQEFHVHVAPEDIGAIGFGLGQAMRALYTAHLIGCDLDGVPDLQIFESV
jgi:hypothetical protein